MVSMLSRSRSLVPTLCYPQLLSSGPCPHFASAPSCNLYLRGTLPSQTAAKHIRARTGFLRDPGWNDVMARWAFCYPRL